ncbi:MAG: hypothetical protein RL338_1011 [Chloroflexota bacterium]|jgi:drug/metabolite transporter (DMT)-like permease
MPAEVIGLVAVAAVLHATWNVLLKTSGDPLLTAERAIVASALVFLPVGGIAYLVAGRPPIPPEALVLATISGVLEVVYFVLLAAAYRRGDVSVVYPIARGSAPLMTVAIGVLVLGERLGPVAIGGVGLLFAGILAILRPWRVLSERRVSADPAVAFAVATGVSIAVYSAVDSVGAKTVPAWLYAWLFYPIGAVLLVAWARFVDPRLGDGRVRGAPAPWGRATLAGLFSLGGYVLILTAYSVAPLAIVSPLRESAIVLGSAYASFRMGEASDLRDGLRRTAGAAIVVAGAVLVAVGA